MSFNPNEHMISLKGKQYLPVNARVAWFRDVHGTSWTIQTEQIPYDESGAFCMKATITDDNGCVVATAHKVEHKSHFPDALEKAETGAVGRALALCGFGTLFAQELETPITPDGDMRIADAPVEPKKSAGFVVSNPVSVDPIKDLSVHFKAEVECYESNVTPKRLKQVFDILTDNAARTPESLRKAISTLQAVETKEQYDKLLISLGTGDNAPF